MPSIWLWLENAKKCGRCYGGGATFKAAELKGTVHRPTHSGQTLFGAQTFFWIVFYLKASNFTVFKVSKENEPYIVLQYYDHQVLVRSFPKQVQKKCKKGARELLKARTNPSTHKQMCAKFFWETAISLMRSRQRHLCQPIQPCSPTSSKASPYSLLRKLNTHYTYSQNWTPCSSRDLWPRVGGAKGDVPEGGGGGQRRPDHPDQVARHHRHQRLPQRWQLQGEQEALRDGSVWGRRHLRTNQVFIAHDYWSSVACRFVSNCHPPHSGQLLQAMCKPCLTHWMCHLCRPSEQRWLSILFLLLLFMQTKWAKDL